MTEDDELSFEDGIHTNVLEADVQELEEAVSVMTVDEMRDDEIEVFAAEGPHIARNLANYTSERKIGQTDAGQVESSCCKLVVLRR